MGHNLSQNEWGGRPESYEVGEVGFNHWYIYLA